MLKFIKKNIIKWSLNQVIKMYNSEKDFGNQSEYGINEIVDFTDNNLMIRISTPKTKHFTSESRKQYIPKMELT